MNLMKQYLILSVFIGVTLFASQPGCWDCVGLNDAEIGQIFACDDHIGPNCDDPNDPGYFGADESPFSDNDPDGPGVHTGCVDTDKVMWEHAYRGSFSLTHKLMLTRPNTCLSDELTCQCVMAYLFYRLGMDEEAINVFKGVDSYLEYHLKLKSS